MGFKEGMSFLKKIVAVSFLQYFMYIHYIYLSLIKQLYIPLKSQSQCPSGFNNFGHWLSLHSEFLWSGNSQFLLLSALTLFGWKDVTVVCILELENAVWVIIPIISRFRNPSEDFLGILVANASVKRTFDMSYMFQSKDWKKKPMRMISLYKSKHLYKMFCSQSQGGQHCIKAHLFELKYSVA